MLLLAVGMMNKWIPFLSLLLVPAQACSWATMTKPTATDADKCTRSRKAVVADAVIATAGLVVLAAGASVDSNDDAETTANGLALVGAGVALPYAASAVMGDHWSGRCRSMERTESRASHPIAPQHGADFAVR